jgi:O-antigen/teichoic acid export membrane protein
MTRTELFLALKRSELLRNTSILISGTAFAQLIPILLQPILRRYYAPEVFGVYSVYLSIVGILAIVASFKYELAIILPKSDKSAINIFFLSLVINIVFSSLLFIVIFIWNKKIQNFLNISDDFAYYLFFIPVGIFCYNLYQNLNNWLTRKKKFFALTINKFIRRGTEGAFQLIFKYLKVPKGIIFGDILGHISNLLSGFWQGRKSGLNYSKFSITRMKYVAARYSDFPKYNVIPSFMSACSFLLPAILLNKFYSSENTGYFDLSKMLLSVPLALISTSLTTVLLQSFTEKYNENKSLIKELKLMFAIVFSICVFEVVVIELFGVWLFKLLFGNTWGFSGEISRILVWAYALNFLVSSFSAIFISLNRIKMLSIWQVIYFITILSLIFFRELQFMEFMKMYVLFEVSCYLLLIFMMVYTVSKYEHKIKTI